MAKPLSKKDVDAIVRIIHSWKDEKFSWDNICEACSRVIGKTPTRQSLNMSEPIKEAYLSKKLSLKTNGQKIIKPSSLRSAGERLAAQQSEIDLLKQKHDQLIEKFIVWQYNAYKHGMNEEKLNEPLPKIDRNQTVKK